MAWHSDCPDISWCIHICYSVSRVIQCKVSWITMPCNHAVCMHKDLYTLSRYSISHCVFKRDCCHSHQGIMSHLCVCMHLPWLLQMTPANDPLTEAFLPWLQKFHQLPVLRPNLTINFIWHCTCRLQSKELGFYPTISATWSFWFGIFGTLWWTLWTSTKWYSLGVNVLWRRYVHIMLCH